MYLIILSFSNDGILKEFDPLFFYSGIHDSKQLNFLGFRIHFT